MNNNIYYINGIGISRNEFKNITQNLFHFTYTKYLKKFGNKNITDGIGWSCAIRSFQMMIAKFLKIFKKDIEILDLIYKEDGILSFPSFVNELNKQNYDSGVFLGAFFISKIYSNIIKKHCFFDFFITDTNIIDENKLNPNKMTLLLFSIRLGFKKIDKKYIDSIKILFLCSNFIGIIGGENSSSYFYYSVDNYNNIYYLDPHKISYYNPNLKNIKKILAKNNSFIKLNKINPSNTFCFYYKNLKEFIQLKKYLEIHSLFKIRKIKKKINNNLIINDNGWNII